MKKILAILLALTMVVSLAACTSGDAQGLPSDDGAPKTGVDAINVIGEDGIDWKHI